MTVDYVEAFKEGIEAAQQAEAARREIDSIFNEVNEQLSAATDNRIAIKRISYSYEVTEPNPIPNTVVGAFFAPSKSKKTASAIVAFNPQGDTDKEERLAKWSQDPAGYPCRVTWPGQEHICEDGEALSNCLGELLRSPTVGEKLSKLMEQAKTESKE